MWLAVTEGMADEKALSFSERLKRGLGEDNNKYLCERGVCVGGGVGVCVNNQRSHLLSIH